MRKESDRHHASVDHQLLVDATMPGRQEKATPSLNKLRSRQGFRGRNAKNNLADEEFNESAAEVAAIRKCQAVIEYAMDGTVIDANEALLDLTGYSLEELVGRNQDMLLDEAARRRPEHKELWAALSRGEHRSSETRRVGKDGREIWVRALMMPVLDPRGKPFKVVSYATDTTAEKHGASVLASHIDCIGKGEIPPQMTESLEGEFDRIKKSLNACIEGLQAVADVNAILKRMAVNDYSQHLEGQRPGVFGDLARSVNASVERIRSVVDALKRIAHGDFSRLEEFKTIGKRSEQDDLLPALILTMENLKALVVEADGLAAAAGEGRLNARADDSRQDGEFKKVIQGMNHILEMFLEPVRVISQNTSTLASSSEEMSTVSQQLAGNAEETATQANLVSAAAEQISGNVASVSSACAQMQISIREIASHASESATVAKRAVEVAQATNRTVTKLGESSQEIGNVIKVITSIAQQTNLLALNATIEAARAGEAGKGFAVVANEVKELAKQTASATEDIGRKIEAIQDDTQGAVKAIGEIGNVVNTINDVSNSIATAVEEQTVTTNEIVRSVNEASKGVSEIAKNIGGVAVAAKNTTQGASDTQQASQQLSRMASQLQQVVAKFSF